MKRGIVITDKKSAYSGDDGITYYRPHFVANTVYISPQRIRDRLIGAIKKDNGIQGRNDLGSNPDKDETQLLNLLEQAWKSNLTCPEGKTCPFSIELNFNIYFDKSNENLSMHLHLHRPGAVSFSFTEKYLKDSYFQLSPKQKVEIFKFWKKKKILMIDQTNSRGAFMYSQRKALSIPLTRVHRLF